MGKPGGNRHNNHHGSHHGGPHGVPHKNAVRMSMMMSNVTMPSSSSIMSSSSSSSGSSSSSSSSMMMTNITMSNASDPIDFAFPLLHQLANASSLAREGTPPTITTHTHCDYIATPLPSMQHSCPPSLPLHVKVTPPSFPPLSYG